MALDLLEALLRRRPEYVLLDAAQDSQILAFLGQNKTEWKSLYDGKSAFQMAEHSPYLSTVSGNKEWLTELLRKFWGRSCLAFVSCDLSLEELRKHLRQLLYVRTPQHEQVYFRFYDPRIMRAFLPTCAPDQLHEFFGPIEQLIVEGDEPEELHALSLDHDKLTNRTGPVTLAS